MDLNVDNTVIVGKYTDMQALWALDFLFFIYSNEKYIIPLEIMEDWKDNLRATNQFRTISEFEVFFNLNRFNMANGIETVKEDFQRKLKMNEYEINHFIHWIRTSYDPIIIGRN